MTRAERLAVVSGGLAAPADRSSLIARAWLAPALLAVSLLLLYVPTFVGLAHGLWQTGTHSHGPVVLGVVVWLFFRQFRAEGASRTQPAAYADLRPRSGWALLVLGLLVYVVGRSQSFPVLEVASLLPVLLGGSLLLLGAAVTRRMGFAFFFLCFLIPLPGSVVDAITQPLKIAVSYVVEHLLHAAGYPIARAGVVLTVGQYKLQVADACSGLNSLFMLEAFGLLYLNVVRHASALRNALLAVLIVPISFASNVLRVVVLVLITYHFGDAAGQGFIHGFSGMVLFAAALCMTVLADTLLRRLPALPGFRREVLR